jgi:S1-C subfamily serine protease
VLFVLLVVMIGFGSGVAGAYLGARAVRPAPPAPVATTEVDQAARIRRAIDRGLPAIVTVVADLPPASPTSDFATTNLGSGIVVSQSGFVITNYHVIAGATGLSIVFPGGERRPAMLIADDSPFNDLAILRVPPGGLQAAPLGDSDQLRLGDPAIVISSGFVTFDNQVKVGVISATHIDFPRTGIVLEDMVQTDASVNHGDSGGALINIDGEVVGLVTTVVRANAQGQTVEGIALAHSMSSLRPVIDAVTATGMNPRPRLGIERLGTQHVPVDPSDPPAGYEGEGGALILAVQPGSPAQSAGIVPGDVVTAVNGLAVTADIPFVNLVGAAPPGRDIRLTVVRGGRDRQVTVTPLSIALVPPSGR